MENYDPYNSTITDIEKNKDLTFLGFIILKNKLKEDTLYFISKIQECSIDLKISTGDSIFTSISVARECCLIKQNEKNESLKMIDLEIFEGQRQGLKM